MNAKILLFMLVFPVSSMDQVLLNEVMFNPSGPESSDEFVEIVNASDVPADLTGWRIGDGSDSDRIANAGGGLILAAGGYGLILDPDYFGNSDTYDPFIPPECLILTLDGSTFGSGGFSNSSAETVTLTDASGAEAGTHTYSTDTPAGYSEQRCGDFHLPDVDSWGPSRSEHGTPGGPNDAGPPPSEYQRYDCVINEIMAAPTAGRPEWFEIVNRSAGPVDLNGWLFSDSDSADAHRIAEHETVVQPDGFAVISQDSSLLDFMNDPSILFLTPGQWTALNNSGDTVHLFDPSGKCIDRVGYEGSWLSDPGVSLERLSPEGASSDRSNWFPCTAPAGMTPGAANSVSAPPVTDRSILEASPDPFSPDGDGFEDVTWIDYRIPVRTARVRLQIYSLNGRLIRTLMGGGASGSQGRVLWDGRDDTGKPVLMGVYVVFMSCLDATRAIQSAAKTTVVVAGRL